MRTTTFGRLASPIPLVGLGTWKMGESPGGRAAEVAALQHGLDIGMTLIDTAEMYASGGAEKVVGEAIRNRRDDVYLVSKVMPDNASRAGVVTACEDSLTRLGVEAIDLYLLHWPASFPLEDTIAGFEKLVETGKIKHWGVSNFDVGMMNECERIAPGRCVTNQVLYNLQRRGIEADLVKWSHDNGVLIMAYSPLDQMRLKKPAQLLNVAKRHDVTPEQIAIAWSVRLPGVITIPKSSSIARTEQNAATADIRLTQEDLAELDTGFPPPLGATELEWL